MILTAITKYRKSLGFPQFCFFFFTHTLVETGWFAYVLRVGRIFYMNDGHVNEVLCFKTPSFVEPSKWTSFLVFLPGRLKTRDIGIFFTVRHWVGPSWKKIEQNNVPTTGTGLVQGVGMQDYYMVRRYQLWEIRIRIRNKYFR